MSGELAFLDYPSLDGMTLGPNRFAQATTPSSLRRLKVAR